jgi:selenide,water dikinase
MEQTTDKIKLTQFSHGAGCGCKISPAVLDIILTNNESGVNHPNLIVGNDSRDDAAVYDLGNGMAMISTTDFFMPIVDDPFDFGRIAATNAISDVYAMGGIPNMAIAILGWPIDKLAPEIAGLVIAGGRKACFDAGIPLAGGHSIDCPEPVFGLAVNGLVKIENIKKNNTAREGDILFLTKELGVGVISTASKRGIARDVDIAKAVASMTTLNKIGAELGNLEGINAMTDVTGFGLLGHLVEMAEGSGLTAVIKKDSVPVISGVEEYLQKGCIPGGTKRNWNSYGHKVELKEESWKDILCDPQTSGGLLIAIQPDAADHLINIMKEYSLQPHLMVPIGRLTSKGPKAVVVE